MIDDDINMDLLNASDYRVKNEQKYYDDITGQILDPQLVQEARRRELE